MKNQHETMDIQGVTNAQKQAENPQSMPIKISLGTSQKP